MELAAIDEHRLAVEMPGLGRKVLLVRIADRQEGVGAHLRDRPRVGLTDDVHAHVPPGVAVVADIGDVQRPVREGDVLPVVVPGVVDGVPGPVRRRPVDKGRLERRPVGVEGEHARRVAAVVVHPVELAGLGLHDPADLGEGGVGEPADGFDRVADRCRGAERRDDDPPHPSKA